MKDSEILRKTQEKIANVSGWVQGSMYAPPTDHPTKWCAVGAHANIMGYISGNDLGNYSSGRYLIAASKAIISDDAAASREYFACRNNTPALSQLPPPFFVNDRMGHGAVMKMFAMAIEMALEDEMEAHNRINRERLLEAVGH